MTFLHLPSNRVIHSTDPKQASRYRRSHRFIELDPPTDPIQSFASPPDSPESPSVAPDTTESATPILIDVPERTIKEILAWVGTDKDLAHRVLDVETAGRNRITLIAALRKLLDA